MITLTAEATMCTGAEGAFKVNITTIYRVQMIMTNSKTYLESHGIDVEEIRVDEITGKKFTFFADPDGLPLELYAL